MYAYNLKQILIIFKTEYEYQPINVCDYKYRYGFFVIFRSSSVNSALFVYFFKFPVTAFKPAQFRYIGDVHHLMNKLT